MSSKRPFNNSKWNKSNSGSFYQKKNKFKSVNSIVNEDLHFNGLKYVFKIYINF